MALQTKSSYLQSHFKCKHLNPFHYPVSYQKIFESVAIVITLSLLVSINATLVIFDVTT